MKGYLKKWINYLKGWQDRYFILEGDCLTHFITESDVDVESRGSIILKDCNIVPSKDDELYFKIEIPSETTLHFRAENEITRHKWIRAIAEAKINNQMRGFQTSASGVPDHSSSIDSFNIIGDQSYDIVANITFKNLTSRFRRNIRNLGRDNVNILFKYSNVRRSISSLKDDSSEDVGDKLTDLIYDTDRLILHCQNVVSLAFFIANFQAEDILKKLPEPEKNLEYLINTIDCDFPYKLWTKEDLEVKTLNVLRKITTSFCRLTEYSLRFAFGFHPFASSLKILRNCVLKMPQHLMDSEIFSDKGIEKERSFKLLIIHLLFFSYILRKCIKIDSIMTDYVKISAVTSIIYARLTLYIGYIFYQITWST